jgi:hypothetical protein
MSKMDLHDPFGHLKHKLWPKEGPGVKLAVWLPTTKVRNRPDFLAWRWCATYRWKSFNEGYNFALDLISIKGLHTKLWGPKVGIVVGVPTLGILGLSIGSLGTKCHLDVGLVERHRVHYKGEGGGFPQVWAVMSLMNPNLPMARLSTKSAPTMH